MNRYFFYLVFVTMLINTIMFVQRILIENRFSGAVLAIGLSIPIGYLFMKLFVQALKRFPQMGLPEIFSKHLPGYIRVPLILYLGSMWLAAGCIVLLSFSILIRRYINPDLNTTTLLIVFIGVSCWCATRNTKAILYVTEILIIILLPINSFILYKTLTSNFFKWNAVKELLDYSMQLPSWTALAAATYLFTGYINMSLYNRVFYNWKPRYLMPIAIVVAISSVASFIIPVGILGSQAVGHYNYIWVTTADSIRLEYGFVERGMYLYLIAYFFISLLFISTTWHVGIKLVEDSLLKMKKYNRLKQWMVGVSYGIVLFFIGNRITENRLYDFVQFWVKLRFFTEMGLVFLVYYLSKRRRKT